jgi:hypothetical protein
MTNKTVVHLFNDHCIIYTIFAQCTTRKHYINNRFNIYESLNSTIIIYGKIRKNAM